MRRQARRIRALRPRHLRAVRPLHFGIHRIQPRLKKTHSLIYGQFIDVCGIMGIHQSAPFTLWCVQSPARMPVQEPFRAFLLSELIKKPPFLEIYYITLDSSLTKGTLLVLDKPL